MKIVHFGPFAPTRCGLYEAARDCVIADRQAGHDAEFVDVGVMGGGQRQAAQVGAIDERCGTTLTTVSWQRALTADVLVAHDGIPDAFLAQTQAPMIWMLHGRPKACLRLQEKHGTPAYTLLPRLASWPRARFLVTFWDEHLSYWRHILPTSKLRSTGHPPVDPRRFSPQGDHHVIADEHTGKVGVLVADSWREDVDIFDVLHVCLEAAAMIDGLRVHVYGCPKPEGDWAWEPLFAACRREGIAGEVVGRVQQMDAVYRSMDVLLTAHRFPTRIMAEALSCGLPVVAGSPCDYTQYTGTPEAPEELARALVRCVRDLGERPDELKAESLLAAAPFTLGGFASKMTDLYRQALA